MSESWDFLKQNMEVPIDQFQNSCVVAVLGKRAGLSDDFEYLTELKSPDGFAKWINSEELRKLEFGDMILNEFLKTKSSQYLITPKKILQKLKIGEKFVFYINWDGIDDDKSTWESEDYLISFPNIAERVRILKAEKEYEIESTYLMNCFRSSINTIYQTKDDEYKYESICSFLRKLPLSDRPCLLVTTLDCQPKWIKYFKLNSLQPAFSPTSLKDEFDKLFIDDNDHPRYKIAVCTVSYLVINEFLVNLCDWSCFIFDQINIYANRKTLDDVYNEIDPFSIFINPEISNSDVESIKFLSKLINKTETKTFSTKYNEIDIFNFILSTHTYFGYKTRGFIYESVLKIPMTERIINDLKEIYQKNNDFEDDYNSSSKQWSNYKEIINTMNLNEGSYQGNTKYEVFVQLLKHFIKKEEYIIVMSKNIKNIEQALDESEIEYVDVHDLKEKNNNFVILTKTLEFNKLSDEKFSNIIIFDGSYDFYSEFKTLSDSKFIEQKNFNIFRIIYNHSIEDVLFSQRNIGKVTETDNMDKLSSALRMSGVLLKELKPVEYEVPLNQTFRKILQNSLHFSIENRSIIQGIPESAFFAIKKQRKENFYSDSNNSNDFAKSKHGIQRNEIKVDEKLISKVTQNNKKKETKSSKISDTETSTNNKTNDISKLKSNSFNFINYNRSSSDEEIDQNEKKSSSSSDSSSSSSDNSDTSSDSDSSDSDESSESSSSSNDKVSESDSSDNENVRKKTKFSKSDSSESSSSSDESDDLQNVSKKSKRKRNSIKKQKSSSSDDSDNDSKKQKRKRNINKQKQSSSDDSDDSNNSKRKRNSIKQKLPNSDDSDNLENEPKKQNRKRNSIKQKSSTSENIENDSKKPNRKRNINKQKSSSSDDSDNIENESNKSKRKRNSIKQKVSNSDNSDNLENESKRKRNSIKKESSSSDDSDEPKILSKTDERNIKKTKKANTQKEETKQNIKKVTETTEKIETPKKCETRRTTERSNENMGLRETRKKVRSFSPPNISEISKKHEKRFILDPYYEELLSNNEIDPDIPNKILKYVSKMKNADDRKTKHNSLWTKDEHKKVVCVLMHFGFQSIEKLRKLIDLPLKSDTEITDYVKCILRASKLLKNKKLSPRYQIPIDDLKCIAFCDDFFRQAKQCLKKDPDLDEFEQEYIEYILKNGFLYILDNPISKGKFKTLFEAITKARQMLGMNEKLIIYDDALSSDEDSEDSSDEPPPSRRRPTTKSRANISTRTRSREENKPSRSSSPSPPPKPKRTKSQTTKQSTNTEDDKQQNTQEKEKEKPITTKPQNTTEKGKPKTSKPQNLIEKEKEKPKTVKPQNSIEKEKPKNKIQKSQNKKQEYPIPEKVETTKPVAIQQLPDDQVIVKTKRIPPPPPYKKSDENNQIICKKGQLEEDKISYNTELFLEKPEINSDSSDELLQPRSELNSSDYSIYSESDFPDFEESNNNRHNGSTIMKRPSLTLYPESLSSRRSNSGISFEGDDDSSSDEKDTNFDGYIPSNKKSKRSKFIDDDISDDEIIFDRAVNKVKNRKWSHRNEKTDNDSNFNTRRKTSKEKQMKYTPTVLTLPYSPKQKITILDIGQVINDERWLSARDNFTLGYKSEVEYNSIIDGQTHEIYVCTIEKSDDGSPLFKVVLKSDPTLCWLSNSISKPWQDILSDVNKWRKINHLPIRRTIINGADMFGLKYPRVRNAILTMAKGDSPQKGASHDTVVNKESSSILKQNNNYENYDDSPGVTFSSNEEYNHQQNSLVINELPVSMSPPQTQNETVQPQQIIINKQQIADVIRINTRNSEPQFVFDFNATMDKIRFMRSLINHELSIRLNPTDAIEIIE